MLFDDVYMLQGLHDLGQVRMCASPSTVASRSWMVFDSQVYHYLQRQGNKGIQIFTVRVWNKGMDTSVGWLGKSRR